MTTICIIQARMGSTRLPGKVLADIGGMSMLARVVRRVRRATLLDDIVIATTTDPADEAIVDECQRLSVAVMRGSVEDVLDRYYQAAKEHSADVIVRITSDCPLIEPTIVDLCVQKFLQERIFDYVSNILPPRSFPRGLDVEVMSFSALEQAWREDRNVSWREHVTPYIYNHPEKFALGTMINQIDYSSMRWTVDTPEDISFVRCIYQHFGHDRFSWHDVLTVLQEYPEWLAINSHIQQKVV